MKKGFLVTIEELEQNPTKLETKLRNLANIELWKSHYHGKRVVNGIQVKPWRDKVLKMEREIKTAQRQAVTIRKQLEAQKEKDQREAEQYAKFHERLVQFHDAIVDKRARFVDRKIKKGTDEYKNFMAIASRTLGNDIHDFTEVKTGLMTLDCYKEKRMTVKNFKPTAEHFWPRSVVGGRDILEQAILMGDKLNIRHTIRTLYQLCQTVESLNTENRELMKHQKEDTFIDPKTSYSAAGIKLVRIKEFSLHTNWQRVFDEYEIPYIPPYEFDDVMSTDEADQLLSDHRKI